MPDVRRVVADRIQVVIDRIRKAGDGMCEEWSVGVQINCISNLLRREIDQKVARMDDSEVSRLSVWIIQWMISRQEQDIFQKDIERALALTRSNVSKAVDQMVHKGLICRSPVEYDARLRKLTLTEKACTIHHRIREDIASVDHDLCEGFAPGELEQLHDYLHRMKENLKRRQNA